MRDEREKGIDYEDYFYDEDFAFGKQALKERLEKQLGDFGEQLVMTLLGRIARYSVAYVDHEGADLIASDKMGHEYAISVKSYQIGPGDGEKKPEDETKKFDKEAQEKLCEFADDFDLIPAVAMIIIPRDFAYIDLYLMTLAAFRKLAGDNSDEVRENAVKWGEKTGALRINNYSLGTGKSPKYSDKYGYLKYLQENELINHIRLDVRNRRNFNKKMKYPEKVHMRKSGVDGNLSRQLGDFGEYFLQMLLGQVKGYKVARVDHVGADLIARDQEGNKYAISVKTTRDKTFSYNENYSSKKSGQPDEGLSKLVEFAGKYKDMKPVIAMVFVDKNFEKINIYIAGLDTWLDIGFSGKYEGIQYKLLQPEALYLKDGIEVTLDKWQEQLSQFVISISTQKKKAEIDAEERMEHMELTFNSWFDPNKKW